MGIILSLVIGRRAGFCAGKPIQLRFLTMLVLLFPVTSIMSAQTCPDTNHPHAIDLGIGVKFACCNVGASSPEQYGGLYSWGEKAEKAIYDEYGYKYAGYKRYSKYQDIGDDISGSQYDVAHVKWEGNWQMPTKEEMELLKDKCKNEWITIKRVRGRRFTGPNGNSIFLPAGGSAWYDDVNYVNRSGAYWTSTSSPTSSNSTSDAYHFCFSENYIRVSFCDRAGGDSVRPVLREYE